jgi:hypothetical protein
MKLEFSRQIFETYSGIKYHEIPSSGSQIAPCGPTEKRAQIQDEAKGRFSHIFEKA